MKTDRRKCFMIILGVLQILIGSLFLALALWAVVIVQLAVYPNGLSPFFLAFLVSVYRSTLNLLVLLFSLLINPNCETCNVIC